MSPILLVLIFLVTLIIVLTLYFWLSEYFTLRDSLGFIPGPKSLPFIGHSWQIAAIPKEDRFEWLNDLCFQYPMGMVVIWLGMRPFLNIRKPEQIEILLRSDTFITKSKTYRILKSWLGKGLLMADGNNWLIQRHIVKSGFEPDALKGYTAIIHTKTDVLIEQIRAKIQMNSKSAINMFPLSVKYAFDTNCRIAVGIDVDTLDKSDNVYTRAINVFCKIATERYLSPWVKTDFNAYQKKIGREMTKSVKILHNFTECLLKQKQKERQEKKEDTKEKKIERNSFVNHILNKNENFQYKLTFQELRQELDTFLFVGYKTVSTTISWALFSLGNAPQIQAKVREELHNVLSENDNPITIEQLTQLNYLDRVIKEVLRLYPSIPIIGRSLDNHVVIGNFFIPKETSINIQIYQLHRDPEIWDDPEVFDPDRFLPENNNKRHPYAYLPFSYGARKCIGDNLALLEIKITLTAILRKWRVSSLLKPSEIKMTSGFSLKPFDNRIELFFSSIN